MSGVKVFTDLLIWQRARRWSKQIFRRTESGRFARDRRLVIQINDSSESVTANIAEGFGRGTQAEFIVFIGYSLGSLNETQSHLCTAYDRNYLAKEDFAALFQAGTEIRKMTVAFVQSMTKPKSGVKHMRKQRSTYQSWTEENWERFERITGRQRPEIFRKKVEDDD